MGSLADALASGFNCSRARGSARPAPRCSSSSCRLAARAVRPSAGRWGPVRQRRLDGQPDRARGRAQPTAASGPRGRLRLGPDSLLGRARAPRSSALRRTAARAPADDDSVARPTWRGRSPPTAPGADPLLRGRQCGNHQHRRRRSAARARGALRAEGVWLHVDGAYGAGRVTRRAARRCAGIERADSLALDPHKWLFQPFESAACSCATARRSADLRHGPRVPAGLDPRRGGELLRRGVQLTRSSARSSCGCRSRYSAWAAFRAAVERGIDLPSCRAGARATARDGKCDPRADRRRYLPLPRPRARPRRSTR